MIRKQPLAGKMACGPVSQRKASLGLTFAVALSVAVYVHLRIVVQGTSDSSGGVDLSAIDFHLGGYSPWESIGAEDGGDSETPPQPAGAPVAEASSTGAAAATLAPAVNRFPRVNRDLQPWAARGITLEDLTRTRKHAAPLINRLSNYSSGMVTTIVKNCVPYMLEGEMAGLVREYGVGSKAKMREFHEMLHAMCRTAQFRVPDVHLIWNVHPWPLLSEDAPVIAAAAAELGPRPKEAAALSRDLVPEMFPGGGGGPASGEPPPTVGGAPGAAIGAPVAVSDEWGRGAELPMFDATWGSTEPAPEGLAPVLSLCKRVGDLDVLYPNMYFRTPNFWRTASSSIRSAARANPWDRRRGSVWWRGNAGWTWPASAPRAMVVARYHNRRWADFAFTAAWGPVLHSWAHKPWLKLVASGKGAVRSGTQTRTPMEVVARFKYALHLPGSYAATYSRTLQFLLFTGTTVLFYDCPYFEYYYDGLQPWVHYIPVNLTNLEGRFRWAQAHPAEAALIAARGLEFANEQLTTEHVFGYWRALLERYAALQQFTVRLPADACSCWSLKGRRSKPSNIDRKARRCHKAICDAL